MGTKVHPRLFRLSTIQTWDALWFAKKDFPAYLQDDERIRAFLWKRLKEAAMEKVLIERTPQHVQVTIVSAKPGFIIGRAGAGIEDLKKAMTKALYPGRRVSLSINVKEVDRPALSAKIVGDQIASEIERRLPFRTTMKSAMDRVMKAGALGVRISIGGRLNGSEIARTEKLLRGKVPLHNLRADVDFATSTAYTIYGTIGIKTWINRGEKFEEREKSSTQAA